jgi:hypothetical protein
MSRRWWSEVGYGQGGDSPGRYLGKPADARGYNVGEVGGLREGLWVVAWVQLADEVVADVRLEVHGSLEALAIADWLAARVVGLALEAACRSRARDALDALGLPVEAGGEALRIEDALRLALSCNAMGGNHEH